MRGAVEPTGRAPRHLTIDVLRGIAVLGILLMNIIAFGLPEQAVGDPTIAGGRHGSDLAAWVVGFVLVDGKMRGLFAMLFGASLAIAAAKDPSPARSHYRRMAVLAMIGLGHFYLIWHGDILFSYAVIGAVAFLFRALPTANLVLLGLVITAAEVAIQSFAGYGPLLTLQSAAGMADADPATQEAFAGVLADPFFSGGAACDEATAMAGNYAASFAWRWHVVGDRPWFGVVDGWMELLPLMLIGIAAVKSGLLTTGWPARRAVMSGLALLLGGLAITSLFAALAVAHDYNRILLLNIDAGWIGPARLMMTTGYAILLATLVRHIGGSSAIVGRLAATGRMALSNYLATSILMTAIFYGWGLGLYGSLSRTGLYGIVLIGWALILWWSDPWLRRYRYGPLEWLWRAMATGRSLPMRRSA